MRSPTVFWRSQVSVFIERRVGDIRLPRLGHVSQEDGALPGEALQIRSKLDVAAVGREKVVIEAAGGVEDNEAGLRSRFGLVSGTG